MLSNTILILLERFFYFYFPNQNMSKIELIRIDTAYSSQKQLSVNSKDNSICRIKAAGSEPEITFKRCTSCTVFICCKVGWLHIWALYQKPGKVKILVSRILIVPVSLLENQPITSKKLTLEMYRPTDKSV